MKHQGKAGRAALHLIGVTFLFVAIVFGIGLFFGSSGFATSGFALALGVLWLLFVGFTLYFFRDPSANVPAQPEVIVSPAHGTVDLIEEIDEPTFVKGRTRRISIFLSVIDIHVQSSPVSGKVAFMERHSGKFASALRAPSCAQNENVLIGLESSERPGERIAVRLVAGALARRIVPWVTLNDQVARGERISLIQFGSRCDIYLPLQSEVTVQLGHKVVGGETVVARRT